MGTTSSIVELSCTYKSISSIMYSLMSIITHHIYPSLYLLLLVEFPSPTHASPKTYTQKSKTYVAFRYYNFYQKIYGLLRSVVSIDFCFFLEDLGITLITRNISIIADTGCSPNLHGVSLEQKARPLYPLLI